MNKDVEMARFNALEPDAAKALLAKYEGAKLVLRSCGYCNGAHEHLMYDFAFRCFACGQWYLDGFPAPVVATRAKGELVTSETMDHFQAVLDEA